MSETRATYMLSPAHVAAVGDLMDEPDVYNRLFPPPGVSDASTYIDAMVRARNEGRTYMFVVTDRGEVQGVCGIADVGAASPPKVVVAIGGRHRGKGIGRFAAERVLDLAFENLQLERVAATADCAARQAFFSSIGFTWAERGLELTREQWLAARTQPAIAALHPALGEILRAEVAAGNEVAEMRSGWPDPDSVFVRLRHPFKTRPASLPDLIQYNTSNDPHWWKEEYTTSNPRHTLAA